MKMMSFGIETNEEELGYASPIPPKGMSESQKGAGYALPAPPEGKLRADCTEKIVLADGCLIYTFFLTMAVWLRFVLPTLALEWCLSGVLIHLSILQALFGASFVVCYAVIGLFYFFQFSIHFTHFVLRNFVRSRYYRLGALVTILIIPILVNHNLYFAWLTSLHVLWILLVLGCTSFRDIHSSLCYYLDIWCGLITITVDKHVVCIAGLVDFCYSFVCVITYPINLALSLSIVRRGSYPSVCIQSSAPSFIASVLNASFGTNLNHTVIGLVESLISWLYLILVSPDTTARLCATRLVFDSLYTRLSEMGLISDGKVKDMYKCCEWFVSVFEDALASNDDNKWTLDLPGMEHHRPDDGPDSECDEPSSDSLLGRIGAKVAHVRARVNQSGSSRNPLEQIHVIMAALSGKNGQALARVFSTGSIIIGYLTGSIRDLRTVQHTHDLFTSSFESVGDYSGALSQLWTGIEIIHKCLTTFSFDPLCATAQALNKWHGDVEVFVNDLNVDVGQIDMLESQYKRYQNLIEVGTKLAADLPKQLKNKALVVMATLQTKVASKLVPVLRNKQREAPFGVLLFGPSGVGKSSLVDIVNKAAGAAYGISEPKTYTYGGNDHFDGWDNETTTIILDDIGKARPQAVQKDPVLQKIIDINNNIPLLLPMAELEDKKGAICRPKVMIGTTNVKSLHAHHWMACPGAVLRRFPYVVTVEVKQQYRMSRSTQLDPEKAQRPDTYKGCIQDLWNLKVESVASSGNEIVYEHAISTGCIAEFTRFIKEKAEIHRQRQITRLKEGNTIRICAKCGYPVGYYAPGDNNTCPEGCEPAEGYTPKPMRDEIQEHISHVVNQSGGGEIEMENLRARSTSFPYGERPHDETPGPVPRQYFASGNSWSRLLPPRYTEVVGGEVHMGYNRGASTTNLGHIMWYIYRSCVLSWCEWFGADIIVASMPQLLDLLYWLLWLETYCYAVICSVPILYLWVVAHNLFAYQFVYVGWKVVHRYCQKIGYGDYVFPADFTLRELNTVSAFEFGRCMSAIKNSAVESIRKVPRKIWVATFLIALLVGIGLVFYARDGKEPPAQWNAHVTQQGLALSKVFAAIIPSDKEVGLKPNVWNGEVFQVAPQGTKKTQSSDAASDESIKTRMAKRTVFLFLSNRDGDVRECVTAIHVYNKVYMTVSHAFAKFKDDIVIKLRTCNDPRIIHTSTVRKVDVTMVPDRDLAFVHLDGPSLPYLYQREGAETMDVVKHCDNVKGMTGYTISSGYNPECLLPSQNGLRIAKTVGLGVSMSDSMRAYSNVRYKDWIFDSDCESFPGDCGSAYMVKIGNVHALAGIHVGTVDVGGKWKRCAVPVDAELIYNTVSSMPCLNRPAGEKVVGISMIEENHGTPNLQSTGLVELHQRSPMNHMHTYVNDTTGEKVDLDEALGRVRVQGLGSLDEPERPRFRSDVRKTPMHDVAARMGHKCDLEAPKVDKNRTRHRLVNALTSVRSGYSQEDLLKIGQYIVSSIVNGIRSTVPGKNVRTGLVPDFEALNGFSETRGSTRFKGINLKTSAGFPYNKAKDSVRCSDGNLMFERVVDAESGKSYIKAHDEFYTAVADSESRALDEGTSGNVFSTFFKDEPVAPSKNAQCKTRVIYASNVVENHILRKLFGSLVAILQSFPLIYKNCPGTNAEGDDWDKLHAQLEAKCIAGAFDGDFSGYDTKVFNHVVMQVVTTMFKTLNLELSKDSNGVSSFDKDDIKLMDAVLNNMSRPYVNFFGDLLRIHGVNPSGQGATVHINGLAAYLIVATTLCKVAENHGELPNIQSAEFTYEVFEEFMEKFGMAFYGDDSLVTTTDAKYNFTAVKDMMASYGIEFTPGLKTEQDYTLKPLQRTDFLKRRFVKDPDYGFIRAPLREEVLDKMLMVWIAGRGDEPGGHAMSMLRTVHRAASMHPKETFLRYENTIKECLKEWIGGTDLSGAFTRRNFPSYEWYTARYLEAHGMGDAAQQLSLDFIEGEGSGAATEQDVTVALEGGCAVDVF
jgi:hypothetical protein